MAQTSILDQLLNSLGPKGSSSNPLGSPGRTASGGTGGLGDLLGQLTSSLGGGAAGRSAPSGGGLSDILGQIQASLGGAGSSAGNLGDRAGQMMGDKGSFAKGAAAGGLVGALLGGKGTAKAAGAAMIGTLAWRAYQNWKASQAGAQPEEVAPDKFLPSPDSADASAEKFARAMLAAATADGRITQMERRRIAEELQSRGFSAETMQLLEEEVDGPTDPAHIAALASNPEEAVQIYLASLLAVDPEGEAEKGYLAKLAGLLRLQPGLVEHLHAEVAGVA